MSLIEIIPLEAKHTEDFIQVISAAFNGYPLMDFFFGNAYQRSIEVIGQYLCDRAMIDDSILLGALVQNELQGIILAIPPEANKNKDETAISDLDERFARSLPDEALERMNIYNNLKNANKPPQPHFYVNVLGVHPRSQGMGIGSQLLEHIHILSDKHSKSGGVALDTQTETNVAYYQNLGYQVSSTKNFDRLKHWFMFREKA
ncbi:MAG TPA: GNAT family N-acetyltransferase [Coleofasciculaceae cyanobacterium]